MKPLKLIGTIFLAIVLYANIVACSDDDKQQNNNSILGEWLCSKLIENEKVSYDDIILNFKNDNTMTLKFNRVGEPYNAIYSCNENGTYIVTFEDAELGTITGTFTVTDNEMVATYQTRGVNGTAYLTRIVK